MKKQPVCSLEKALDYQNDEVLYRFIGIFEMPFEEACTLFNETKKWIWLAAVAEQEGSIKLLIDGNLLFIDEMWHNFILFTKEYSSYCLNYFGFFVHHHPTLRNEKLRLEAEIREDPSLSRILKVRRHQYSYIYDKLGPETLELWYGKMCYRYTAEYLLSIRKK